MKREVMLQTVGEIIRSVIKKEQLVGSHDKDVEDASEVIVKVFEKSLKESIGEATRMLPKGLFKGLFKGIEKK